MVGILEQIAVILAFGLGFKAVADRLNIPYIVFFILGGTLLASAGLLDISAFGSLPELVRTLAIIIAVFSAGFYMNLGSIAGQSKAILWLSSFGVIITALLIAGVTLYLLPITVFAAIFLGVLLCGTDVSGIASDLEKHHGKVLTILGAESIFNTPLAIILPLMILGYAVRPETAWLHVPKLISLVVVGVGVGLIAARLGQYALVAARQKHEEIVGLMVAIATYVTAESLSGSGILAVALCSVLLMSTKIPEKRWLGAFNKELAFLFMMFVFILLGAEFTFSSLLITQVEIFAIIAALIVSRLLMSMLVLYKSDTTIKERLMIGFIAPKGLSAASLAPLLLLYPAQIDANVAAFIVKVVYFSIIISILSSILAMRFAVNKDSA